MSVGVIQNGAEAQGSIEMLILSSAYGRNPKTKKEVFDLWYADKDFVIRNLGANGTVANRPDCINETVQFRFNSDRGTFIHKETGKPRPVVKRRKGPLEVRTWIVTTLPWGGKKSEKHLITAPNKRLALLNFRHEVGFSPVKSIGVKRSAS